MITSQVTLVCWAPSVSIQSLFIYHQRHFIKILIVHISVSLTLILWFLMSLDLCLSETGSCSPSPDRPVALCLYFLIHLNYTPFFLFLALRPEANEMPLTNIPGWFPARADVASFMPLDFRRLIGISRPPDSSGIKSHFSNLSIWGWTRKKKKREKLKWMN